jgi:hypothetical protein
MVPQARVIALLVNPNNPDTERSIEDVQEAARVKGLQLRILKAGTESGIDDAFASFVELQAERSAASSAGAAASSRAAEMCSPGSMRCASKSRPRYVARRRPGSASTTPFSMAG